ncbi:putative K+ channel tetramerization subfamily protein [Paratrimastix pyriformis]|uniref:K+ channel tetramerization subfamily protein n=1 Tax=Paratrimastix pyriformis TaxID=342808 RepID=A0ABQ8UHZ4_9EUKA|nr:putative K+ channel tetramerization subfamily protein [Paratrimastix pyriformis]
MAQPATATAADAVSARDPLADFHATTEAMLATVSGAQERILAKKKEIDDIIQKLDEDCHVQVARLQELQRECEKQFAIQDKIITVNVGGRMFTTYRNVLLSQEDSMLAAMFSGRHSLAKGPDGVPFIDRNPNIFEKILDFLRTGRLPRWWVHPEERNDFLEEVKYYGLNLPSPAQPALETVIMTPDECGKLVEFTGAKSLALLYRGTRDGFQSATFHRLCDGRPHTVAVVRATTDHVFGGYAAATWNQASNNYYDDKQAFVFSLRGTPRSPVKIPHKQSDIYGIYCNPAYGPTWGHNFDLCMADGCNANSNSYTNLGYTYGSPDGAPYFLTGGNNKFQVAELEVFACAM